MRLELTIKPTSNPDQQTVSIRLGINTRNLSDLPFEDEQAILNTAKDLLKKITCALGLQSDDCKTIHSPGFWQPIHTYSILEKQVDDDKLISVHRILNPFANQDIEENQSLKTLTEALQMVSDLPLQPTENTRFSLGSLYKHLPRFFRLMPARTEASRQNEALLSTRTQR